jgi:hypothetical protein
MMDVMDFTFGFSPLLFSNPFKEPQFKSPARAFAAFFGTGEEEEPTRPNTHNLHSMIIQAHRSHGLFRSYVKDSRQRLTTKVRSLPRAVTNVPIGGCDFFAPFDTIIISGAINWRTRDPVSLWKGPVIVRKEG